jgi:bacillolysin
MSTYSVRRRRVLIVGTFLLIAALMASTALAAPPVAQDGPTARLEAQADGFVNINYYAPTGVARSVYASNGSLTREFAGQAPEAAARSFLAGYGSLFGLTDQGAQLQLNSVQTDELGMQHVRFSQIQDDLAVFGADLIVHLAKDGAVSSVNGYIVPDAISVSTKPALSDKQAAEIALKQLGVSDGFISQSSLVVFNAGLITEQSSNTVLTYRVRADSVSQPHLAQWIFVDANTGEVRFAYAGVTDGRNRETYNLKHLTNYRKAILVRSETTPPVTTATNCTITDINNAHDYAGNTYDFYFNRFRRDSYDNRGGTLKSYVCYGTNYQNAFWDGTKMTYGNGFAAADDVVAHELSHGVTENASNLVYSSQSGALNESFSDIFGEAVDLTNTGGNDNPNVKWDMGEDIPGIGAIRDMMDPIRFSDPDKTTSTYYYCGTGDNGGVHTNSGVPNKAFALMVDGGNFNNYSVSAIGMDAAAAIEYRSNTTKLTSSAKFYDNYTGLINSCGELYSGTGSPTCTSVKNALNAVVMYGPICGTGGGPMIP